MTECKNCKTQLIDSLSACITCNFPINGSEKEQARFIAKQVIDKADVKESFSRLKNARYILFFLGGFYLLVPIVSLIKEANIVLFIINFLIGIFFIGSGLLTFKKPKIALIIPLCLIVFYYLILLIVDPISLMSGILWKVIVLSGLIYGLVSILKSDKILNENEYLASIIMKEKKTN